MSASSFPIMASAMDTPGSEMSTGNFSAVCSVAVRILMEYFEKKYLSVKMVTNVSAYGRNNSSPNYVWKGLSVMPTSSLLDRVDTIVIRGMDSGRARAREPAVQNPQGPKPAGPETRRTSPNCYSFWEMTTGQEKEQYE